MSRPCFTTTLAALMLTGLSAAACTGDSRATAAQVVEECESLFGSTAFADSTIEEGDGQIRVELSGVGDYDGVVCVLDKAGAPRSVAERIKQTNEEAGTQTASWDGWEAVWTRHSNVALEVAIIPA